jgi:DNA-directed RNA polymerase subunit RPC12/RpoP
MKPKSKLIDLGRCDGCGKTMRIASEAYKPGPIYCPHCDHRYVLTMTITTVGPDTGGKFEKTVKP